MNILHKWFSNEYMKNNESVHIDTSFLLVVIEFFLDIMQDLIEIAFIDMLQKLVFYEIVRDLMCMILIENY